MNFTSMNPERSQNESAPDPRIQAINNEITKRESHITLLRSQTLTEDSLSMIQEAQRLIDQFQKDKMNLINENKNKVSSTETEAQRMARLADTFDIHGVSKTQPGVISLEANGFDRFNDRRSS